MDKLPRAYSPANPLQAGQFPTTTGAPHVEKIKADRAAPASCAVNRCGIILAGGEGRRLIPFIFRLRGDALPKQYVNFIGSRSMLEHTLLRAGRLIPPERLFVVVNQHHLAHAEVRRQLSGRPNGTVVVQPENKETGPGLLLPLLHVHRRYPDSTVTIFPSDHFIVGEKRFMAHVDLACRVVERYPSSLVMLGIEPGEPETDYGYILPSKEIHGRPQWGVRKVVRFIEKPESRIARELILSDGLWNSMVIAFKVKTMLDLIERATPLLFSSFHRIREVVGTCKEGDVVKACYARMEAINFSRGVLEAIPPDCPSPLLVLPVRGVFWSDWGSEERISRVMRQGIVGGGATRHFGPEGYRLVNFHGSIDHDAAERVQILQSSISTAKG